MDSLTLRFFLNKNTRVGDKLKIYGRIRVNRVKAEFYTGFAIEPNEWDEDRQAPKRNITIKQELLDYETRIYKIRRSLIDHNITPTVKMIADILKNKQNIFKPKSFIEFYEEFIQKMIDKGERAKSTVMHYQGTLKIIKKFFVYSKKRKLDMSTLDYKFINDLDYYMSAVYISPYDQKLARNTINKHHARVRAVIHAAILENYLEKNPYSKFKLKFEKTYREHLSIEELGRIEKLDLSNNYSLDKIRDIFLFSCNTAVRFNDAQNLTMSNIKPKGDGKSYLELKMDKTSEIIAIPLTQQAMSIIDKYAESNHRTIQNKILPQISNQKFNAFVKTIAKMANIKKNISHHVARHTFATIGLNKGMPKEVIQLILGHTSVQTTEIYAKMLQKTVFEEMKKMEK